LVGQLVPADKPDLLATDRRAGDTGGRLKFHEGLAEQLLAGDGLQRPLLPRFRCLPRLKRGVDMTADVEDCEQLFYVCIMSFSLGRSEEPEPVKHNG
jgi:hypothetical protein